jgi:hypothetical protein
VGLAVGVPVGKARAARLFSQRSGAVAHELAAFSATQFRHADAAHARAAVQLEIQNLSQIARLPGRYQLVPPQPELMVAYVRLGMIEESAGHSSAAREAFQQARALQSEINQRSAPTDEQLRGLVRRQDEMLMKVGE